jgi:hypothetical protein
MTPELISALRERLARGQSQEAITAEMKSVGYTDEVIRAAYAAALAIEDAPVLMSIWETVIATWHLFVSERQLLQKALLVCIGVCAVVGSLMVVLFHSGSLTTSATSLTTFLVAPLLGVFVIGITTLALFRALLLRQGGELFRTHHWFVFRQLVPLSLVFLCMTIVTQVGYALLYIPGIAASVYLLFATPIALERGVYGLAALIASVRLVAGRFFSVLFRYLCVLILPTMVVGGLLVVGVLGGQAVAALFSQGPSITPLPGIVVGTIVLTLSFVYWGNCARIVIYEDLKATPSPAPLKASEQSLRGLFMVIIGLGLIGFTVFVAITGFLSLSALT